MELSKYQNIGKSYEVSGNDIMPYVLSLCEYMTEQGIDIKPYPKLIFSNDASYSQDPFGKTAYYNPNDQEVVLYTAGRHIKDVLRSFAHEMIHHSQNLSGALDMSNIGDLNDPNYTQNNKTLRNLEKDAYLRGNMLFRDWEDTLKN